MSGAVTWPGAPATCAGYTVTGTGAGDAGFSDQRRVRRGYEVRRRAERRAHRCPKHHCHGRNSKHHRDHRLTAIDFAEQAGTFLDTLSYTLTANYN